MNELYKDKHANFMVDYLELTTCIQTNLLNEDIEVLKKINPKKLVIYKISWTIENIKALSLLSHINFNINLNYSMYFSKLLFLNIPIQLFDSNSNQRFSYECGSIEFRIDLYKFEQVKLIKTDTSNLLFIPLNTIGMLMCSEFMPISSEHDIIKQFVDLDIEKLAKTNGFIVPLKYQVILIEFII